MSKQQHTLMRFDPATGWSNPYPSHAQQWREFNGTHAWLFNPWTGERRGSGDVGDDPFGRLILPPGEPVYAAGVTVVYGSRPTEQPCMVCGKMPAAHGSYPTCATHPYTPNGNCGYVIGAACVGAECKGGCVRARGGDTPDGGQR